MDHRKKDDLAKSEVIKVRVLPYTRKEIAEYVQKVQKVDRGYNTSRFLREAIHAFLNKETKNVFDKMVLATSFIEEVKARRKLSDVSTEDVFLKFLANIWRNDEELMKSLVLFQRKLEDVILDEQIK